MVARSTNVTAPGTHTMMYTNTGEFGNDAGTIPTSSKGSTTGIICGNSQYLAHEPVQEQPEPSIPTTAVDKLKPKGHKRQGSLSSFLGMFGRKDGKGVEEGIVRKG